MSAQGSERLSIIKSSPQHYNILSIAICSFSNGFALISCDMALMADAFKRSRRRCWQINTYRMLEASEALNTLARLAMVI